MIKLKNILAENMRRFGTKNLSETNLQDLENKLGFDSGANRDPRTGNLKTNKPQDADQNNNGYPDSTEGSNATIPFPTWYNSFIEKLAVKLQERIDLDVDDLKFEVVDPHLMGLDATMFGPKGLNFFPTAVRSVLKDPEFAGKAMMVWDNTGQIEDKLVAKHPELEDFIYNEEKFWVYIK